MHNRRSFTPMQRREYWRRRSLEHAATGLIRAADRQQENLAPPRPHHDERADINKTPGPQRLTLADLPLLRRLGRVP